MIELLEREELLVELEAARVEGGRLVSSSARRASGRLVRAFAGRVRGRFARVV